jgi:hypothetical protein
MSGVSLYIEGLKIDLSDKEGINIKLNTQDINDISKVNAGYSKDFSVQATPSNNKFFKHYYNADITGGFDARTKKQATIYLDELFFISGRIRLTSTSLKNNLIVSYRIQFEGDVVNVKDVLGDKKLSDLDLSQFNHDYTSAKVKEGLTDSLFNGSVVYPLISPVNRFLFDSSNNYVATENSKNINFNSADLDQSINYNELKPALRIADIIFLIEEQNNINFIGDFFTRDYYNNLFMWFSNDEGLMNVTATNENSIITFTNPSPFFSSANTLDLDLVDNESLLQFRNLRLTNTINVPTQFNSVQYSYVITLDNNEIYRQDNLTGTNSYIYTTPLSLSEESGVIRFYIISESVFSYDSDLEQKAFYSSFLSNETITYSSQSNLINVSGQVVLEDQAPDIKQIDLITGIIKMFNIALTANSNGDIIWQTLPDWYSEGREFKNFEKYIDLDKTLISRGKLNNEFDFKYEDPSTILAIQYEKNNIDAYGDLEQRLTEDPNDPDSELLDGSKLEISLPFENMVNERLRDLADNTNTSFQYGYSVDESLNPTVPKPVLFYNLKNQSPIIGFKEDDGTVTALLNQLNTPNNTNSLEDNTKQSINFSVELSTYNFGAMPNTLYNSFYSDYITDMFNNQRRVYVFDAIIPNFILADIKLNDRLIIANKRYIINSINSNLTTGKTKLELLNDIYESGELIGEQFYAVPNFFNVVVDGGEIQSTIYNNGETVLSLVDEGDGIFASIVGATTFSGVTTKTFNIQTNSTGLQRVMSILCTKGTESFKITILQEGTSTGSITFDNNNITFDNTNITFDNQ